MKTTIIAVLLFFFCLNNAKSQKFLNDNQAQNVKTVLLAPNTTPGEFPFIKLNSSIQLNLDFDVIGDEQLDLAYTIIHCQYNWLESNLNFSDYAIGQESIYISTVDFSNTNTIGYLHYSAAFPNEQLSITRSGNYILRVVDELSEEVLIQRKFIVYENNVAVNGKISPSASVRGQNNQYLYAELAYNTKQTMDPYNHFKVLALQNDRFDFTQKWLKTSFIHNQKLILDEKLENSFVAGNEFRFIDIRSLLTQGYRTLSFEKISDEYHLFLKPDHLRSQLDFQSFGDLNGKYFIECYESGNAETDAEYITVHFSLKTPFLISSPLYIVGAFNNWKIDEDYRLIYDDKTKLYHLKTMLKQGFYNYSFVNANLDEQEVTFDSKLYEGNFYETENKYTLVVYLFDPIFNTHKVVGINNFTINRKN